jgi:hypothetical protein
VPVLLGVCIEMRDDPADAKIPEKFKPSSYHKEQLDKYKEKLSKIKSMTIEEATQKSKTSYKTSVREYEKYLEEKKELKIKYEEMLEQVKLWTPPSKDHRELKNFMVQQITDSISSDCSTDFCESPKLLSGTEWKEKEIKDLECNLDYHQKGYKEEVEGVEKRNNWIRQLRESLKD